MKNIGKRHLTRTKKTVIFVVLLIVAYIILNIAMYERQHKEGYKFKKYITTQYDEIKKYYISSFGPYYGINIVTEEQLNLIDVQRIFEEIKNHIDQDAAFRQEIIDRHYKETQSGLGVIYIEFKDVTAQGSFYTFYGYNKSNFKEWKMELGEYYLKNDSKN